MPLYPWSPETRSRPPEKINFGTSVEMVFPLFFNGLTRMFGSIKEKNARFLVTNVQLENPKFSFNCRRISALIFILCISFRCGSCRILRGLERVRVPHARILLSWKYKPIAAYRALVEHKSHIAQLIPSSPVS